MMVMSGIVLHFGAAIALAGLAVSAQGAEIALAIATRTGLLPFNASFTGRGSAVRCGYRCFGTRPQGGDFSGDSEMDGLATTHILRGRYELHDRLKLNTHVGRDLGKEEIADPPAGYTLRYWGPGPYQGSEATLGFSQRLSLDAALDTGIGWKGDLGLLSSD